MSEQPISPDPLAPPEIGSRLAQARQAAALSIDHVAAKLLVSASQIQAIESGSMPSSYSAGYYERTVRKYADFLNIEVDQAVLPAAAAAVGQAHAGIQDGTPAARLAGFTPQRVGIGGRIDRPTIGSSRNAKAWIAGAFVLILVVAGFVFRDKVLDPSTPAPGSDTAATSASPSAPSSPSSSASPSSASSTSSSASPSSSSALSAPAASATPSLPPAPAAASSASAPPSLVAANAANGQPNRSGGVSSSSDSSAPPAEGERSAAPAPEVSALSSAASRAAAATAPASATPPDSGSREGRIKVTFDAPCWVQLIKSDGTRAEKIFQPDQELEFPADALASLVIGNARSARMTIDGRDVNLSKFMKSDVVRMSDATLREALR